MLSTYPFGKFHMLFTRYLLCISIKFDIVVIFQTWESCKFGLKIDTGFQIGTARFDCVLWAQNW